MNEKDKDFQGAPSPNLKDILLKDLAGAKEPPGIGEPLPAGTYVGKIIGFTEEETFQYVTIEVDKKRYNFFYNYYIYGTTDLNADVINWIKALATIPTTDTTTLLDIANSAIGSSYRFTVYNYKGKSGKNAGKVQHAISFSDKPEIEIVEIEEEEIDTEELAF